MLPDDFWLSSLTKIVELPPSLLPFGPCLGLGTLIGKAYLMDEVAGTPPKQPSRHSYTSILSQLNRFYLNPTLCRNLVLEDRLTTTYH